MFLRSTSEISIILQFDLLRHIWLSTIPTGEKDGKQMSNKTRAGFRVTHALVKRGSGAERPRPLPKKSKHIWAGTT